MTVHQIPSAAPICACDETEAGLMTVDAALRRGLALCTPVRGTDTVPLDAASGRILAVPALAPMALPPFDSAAMDGYALRRSSLCGPAPWVIPVTGRIVAGMAAPECLADGSAQRIFTGAPIPPDCDAVVMQEHVTRTGDSIRLERCPARGENIRRKGEDLQTGAEILPAGRMIGAREAAALAAVGLGLVAVHRRVRVAILATGSELCAPGEPLGPGQIWNTNRSLLRTALGLPWIALDDLGALPDDPAALSAALMQAASTADLVISTGGVSVGDEDHMPRLLHAAGGSLAVLKVAMKPGKPVTLGRLGDAVYVGLPGNPVSAFVTWKILGAPMAAALGGEVGRARRPEYVRAAAGMSRRPGRCEFRPARLTGTAQQGVTTIELLDGAFSHRIALLAGADGLAVIPAETDHIREGDLLEFLRF